MVDLAAIMVQARAQRAAWAGQGRQLRGRLKKSRHVLISAALVIAGLAGAAGGGWLIGRWCLGLVLITESAGAVWWGVMRDDGTALPRRGERTVAEVLEEHRRIP